MFVLSALINVGPLVTYMISSLKFIYFPIYFFSLFLKKIIVIDFKLCNVCKLKTSENVIRNSNEVLKRTEGLRKKKNYQQQNKKSCHLILIL